MAKEAFQPNCYKLPNNFRRGTPYARRRTQLFYIMGQFLAWGTSGDHWKIWISLQVFLNHLLEMNIELLVRLFSAACSVHPYPVLIILSLYWSDLLKTMMCYCNGNASSYLCHFTLPQTAEIKGCSLAEQGQGLEIWVKSGYRMYV